MRSILSMPRNGHAVKLRKGAKATLQGATIARQYWRGEKTATPQTEVIFDGKVEVVDIIGA
jgi:hypothetical protein